VLRSTLIMIVLQTIQPLLDRITMAGHQGLRSYQEAKTALVSEGNDSAM
jgi:hypothetical protein